MANVKGEVMEPITKYTIKTLSSEDYDSLPYLHARESAGLTDRFLKVAYVRDTGDVEYDTDTLIHEIEEMETDKWSHEDKYGVRYKSFMRSFGKTFVGKYVVPAALWAVPGVGPALAAGYGAINQYQNDSSLRGAATGAATGITSGMGGQGLISGLQGAITGGTQAGAGFLSKGAGIVSGFGQGLTNGLSAAANRLPGISGVGQGGATAATASPYSIGGSSVPAGGNLTISGATTPSYSIGGGAIPTMGNLQGSSAGINAALSSQMPSIGNIGSGLNTGGLGGGGTAPLKSSLGAFNVGNAGAGINASATAPAQQSILQKFMSGFTGGKEGGGFNMGKIGTGMALAGAGQMMGPQTPEMPESRFAQMMEQGGLTPRTAIGQQAMQKASELLAQNPQGLPDDYKNAVLADFDERFADEEKLLRSEYKNLRPNADIENDTAFKRDLMDLRQEQTEYKSNTLAKLEQANFESNKKFQRDDIINAMGIDEQTFNEYASLANQDLNKIMMQTGLDYGTAQQFKDMFGQLGGAFVSSGLGLGGGSLASFNVGK